MITSDFRDFDIRSIRIFKNLSFAEQEKLRHNLNGVFLKNGQSIYEIGRRLRGVYYVKKGVIKLYKTGSKGKDQIFYFLKEGDIFGYEATLYNITTNVCAKAIVNCELIYIPEFIILQLFEYNPKTRISILQSACKELSRAQSLIVDIAQKSNKRRVIEFLFDMEKNFNVDNQNFISIPMKICDMADHIGASREGVIRIISELRKHQLITTNKKRIGILDMNRLKNVVS